MGLKIEVQDMVMKRSFKDVICQNTQTIPELPKNVFRMDHQNMESCEEIVEFDFEKIAGIISGGHGGMSPDRPESSTIYASPSGESSTNEVWSENSANESTSASSGSSDTTTAAETLYEISTKENSTTETYKDIYI